MITKKHIPNALTFMALLAGQGALYCALASQWKAALFFLIAAAAFDKLDGAAAKFLKCESILGAKFDSLADAVNFGIIPPVILYCWQLKNGGVLAILACLVYSSCALWRLIVYTKARLSENKGPGFPGYFSGVPTPAGAFLALLPLLIYLNFSEMAPTVIDLTPAWLVIVGVLMVSGLPAFALVERRAMKPYRKYFIILAIVVAVLLIIKTVDTLIVIDVGYLLSMPICYVLCHRKQTP